MSKKGRIVAFYSSKKTGLSSIASVSSKNKRKGQITIFIIAGMLLVAGILIFFLFRGGVIPEIGGQTESNPASFLDSCIDGKISEAGKEISISGGDLNPELYINFMFTDDGFFKNISYLCYTQNNFRPCVVQKPTLLLDMQNEIKDYISEDFKSCFSEMLKDYQSQGFYVGTSSGLDDFDVELEPRRITLKTNSEVTLTKSGETTTEEDLKVIVPSRLYEIVLTANEIASQESQFCYFESTGFVLAYPEFSIDKFIVESGVKIYTIMNDGTEEKFRFAVRSCAVPPGF